MFKKFLLSALFIGFVISLGFCLKFFTDYQIKINTNTNIDNNISNTNLPVRLKIPKISVDSVVEHLGLTKDGLVDAPNGPDNVAWFNQSQIPGGVGIAIIDGHSGWKNGLPAVFDNLHKLNIGDKIFVENQDGSIIVFIVKDIKIYKIGEDYSDVFISNDTKSHLNLITCTGSWNARQNTSSDRLVVSSVMYYGE